MFWKLFGVEAVEAGYGDLTARELELLAEAEDYQQREEEGEPLFDGQQHRTGINYRQENGRLVFESYDVTPVGPEPEDRPWWKVW